MAHKDRDGEAQVEERPSERRHRTKSAKERDSTRKHKSSRSSRAKEIDLETGEPVKSHHRSRREKDTDKKSEPIFSMTDLVPELARTSSAPGATSRGSLPYPSFNKAHSKEAVNSREDFRLPTRVELDQYTPEPTDLGSADKLRSKSVGFDAVRGASVHKDGRPPSPPETEVSQQKKATPNRMTKVQEEVESEPRPASRGSSFRKARKEKQDERDDRSKISKASKASTAIKTPRVVPEGRNPFGDSNAATDASHELSESGTESNLTSVAPKAEPQLSGQRPPALDTDSSPDSAQDSSPQTPTQVPQFPPPDLKSTPSPFIHFDAPDPSPSEYSPQPPPPPPPPNVPIAIPQVDYLLQNGGLLRPASKTLLSTPPPINPQYGSRSATPMPPEISQIFGPFYSTLDQYETVIAKNGSLAVATGYRSVARRLLDRLENVFNRDLSAEGGCFCVICEHADPATGEERKGLGWGEVLEWVSGRRELPPWPAFDFATLGVKAGEDLASLGGPRNPGDGIRPGSPVKIDPDVADEYRDHYLAQSKKTKSAVNKWLSSCPQSNAAPPQEVDDETLSFAILTHLDQHDRPLFNALIQGSNTLQPVSRAPTPMQRKPRSDSMIKTVQALQKLYRLPVPPRDPEAAIYLLKNPHLHNLLVTMSSINPSEWEILTSGRFDGFLWSGAESESNSPSAAPSRGPTPANGNRGPPTTAPMHPRQGSRTNTPFSPLRNQTFSPPVASGGFASRGPTPFGGSRNPVSNDEETEIAVLAEIEREIYAGMEALEDAFEGLHRKAEYVRRALRERGAGLSMSLQSRRLSQIEVMRFGTPGLGMGYERPSWHDGGSEIQSESEWDPADEQSEIAPDDSASNISSSRHRRPKRRTERRTPAPVEEEDEE
ncbi:hypothetical protein BJ875DRAFT_26485 [Amylocarpus encephaloides]|uniref:5-Methylcytosine G/T mismatch-specific DNA glycosylase n=1 Tax=Amylocarpus encephaloides TaxID=45428 RepID=A0A9P8C505_9HELO|nr:hypothetical protein BJ875DRAFT_26485 [Amylocarpus encephaloides]